MRGVFGSKPIVYNGFVKMRNTQFESVLTASNGHIYGIGERFGVVDWEGAYSGDHRFDLTSFAFCTDSSRRRSPLRRS